MQVLIGLLLMASLNFADTNPLEQMFASGFGSVVGNPLIEGLVLLGFFFAFTMLQNTRTEGKVAILIPAAILSMLFIPFLAVFIVIILAYLGYSAITRAANR